MFAGAEKELARLREVEKVCVNQQHKRKVAAYDDARGEVKRNGDSRAFYVLQAEADNKELKRLRRIEAAAKAVARGDREGWPDDDYNGNDAHEKLQEALDAVDEEKT